MPTNGHCPRCGMPWVRMPGITTTRGGGAMVCTCGYADEVFEQYEKKELEKAQERIAELEAAFETEKRHHKATKGDLRRRTKWADAMEQRIAELEEKLTAALEEIEEMGAYLTTLPPLEEEDDDGRTLEDLS